MNSRHSPRAASSYGRMVQENFVKNPKAAIGHPDVYRIIPAQNGGFRVHLNEQVRSNHDSNEMVSKKLYFTGDELAHLVEHARPYMEAHAVKRKKADAILASALKNVSSEDLELLRELGHNIS